MRLFLRRHRIACFLAVTYAFTWSVWLALASEARRVAIGFEPLYLLGLLGPLVGALATTAITDGRPGLRELGKRMIRVRIGLRWWLVAIGGPLGVYLASCVILAAYALFLFAPIELPSWASLGELTGFPMTNGLALFAWIFVINGFGEETGWRGFLLPELQRKHSPVVASLLVAACWAPWHAPAFLVAESYRAMPIAMIPMFVLGLASGSVIMTWLYNRGRGSIPLVAGFHAAFNLFSGTVGVRGGIAALESTTVVIVAAILVVVELRAHHVMPPGGRPVRAAG